MGQHLISSICMVASFTRVFESTQRKHTRFCWYGKQKTPTTGEIVGVSCSKFHEYNRIRRSYVNRTGNGLRDQHEF